MGFSLIKNNLLKLKDSLMKIRILLLVSAVLSGFLPGRAAAQGTAFTYQGRLNDTGNPANGNYDLQFTVYDSTNPPGTLIAGPLTNAPTPVSNGLFSVTLDFGPGVFNGNPRALQIGVRTNGSVSAYSILSPRQAFTASPYAITAGNVTGPVSGSQIAAGSITGAQLAGGAAAANLQAGGQSAVPGGGMILSSNYNDGNLAGAGYVKIGSVDLGDVWQQDSDAPPGVRAYHVAVWTGSEMLVWGGINSGNDLNDGGRYNPALNTWTTIPTTGAPLARQQFTAVWTGTEMIVWGGYNGTYPGNYLNNGGRYNPGSDTWSALPSTGAPSARYNHTAVWTGTGMIIWGGANANFLNDGAQYNPSVDTWTAVNSTNAPAPRNSHTAVWTGSQMIVWGGYNGAFLNDGGLYNPSANSWSAVTTAGAPSAREIQTAVWTGTEMIVWGGFNGAFLNDGGRYDPGANSWTAVTATGAPAAREGHTAVWTGSQMLVWGGLTTGPTYLNDGGLFNPSTASWSPVTTAARPPDAWTIPPFGRAAR